MTQSRQPPLPPRSSPQVQLLSVAEIAEQLHRLQTLAAANQLSPTDVTGGTVTVSNIGEVISPSLLFVTLSPCAQDPSAVGTPPLWSMPPRSRSWPSARRPSTLASTSRARWSPGERSSSRKGKRSLQPRHRALSSPLYLFRSLTPVSWGADHRVLDGASLARLNNAWKRLIEEPSRWLLHLR